MGRKPDYEIKALDKSDGVKGIIGAGWKEDNGRISITFNPFVVVPVGKRFAISLFPIEDASVVPLPGGLTTSSSVEDDELPF